MLSSDSVGQIKRRIGFLLIDDFSLMSFSAAVEPLRAANTLAERQLYRWDVISLAANPSTSSSGVRVSPDLVLGQPQADCEPFDDILVCVGGNPATFSDPATFAWFRKQARRGVRLGGVSGGTWLLARAGVMDGYRCTIHWEHIPAFRESFPDIDLRPTLFEIDRDRLSCAGGIAALDLMRELIETDCGAELASQVSEWFVQTNVRMGNDPQRMEPAARFKIHSQPLARALTQIKRSYKQPLTTASLARSVGISSRHLQRLFLTHLGTTLERYLFNMRLDHARQLLRQSTLSVLDIALASGFTAASHFSRLYRDRFGISPRQERNEMSHVAASKSRPAVARVGHRTAGKDRPREQKGSKRPRLTARTEPTRDPRGKGA